MKIETVYFCIISTLLVQPLSVYRGLKKHNNSWGRGLVVGHTPDRIKQPTSSWGGGLVQ
jgi:hypothetical protein